MSVLVRKGKITQVFSREKGRQSRFAIFGGDAFTPVIHRLAPLSGKDCFSLFNLLIMVSENNGTLGIVYPVIHGPLQTIDLMLHIPGFFPAKILVNADFGICRSIPIGIFTQPKMRRLSYEYFIIQCEDRPGQNQII
jgi:hypothetical protein